ncbi:MAG: hypothetical protein M1812_002297 [Candelaria pacifica]|nr:MAG: hypothetical protein M1812_002297 [Candelaria pacifica]
MSEKLEIIGIPESGNVLRVLLTLAELGVTDYTMTAIKLHKGEQKELSHLAVHPFGQIPVMKDGSFTLFESRAIARYLVVKYADKGTALMPNTNDLEAVALFEQWASVEVDQFNKVATPLILEVFLKPKMGIPADNKAIEEYTNQLNAKLDILERILSNQAYMGGATFSLLDIFYMPAMTRLVQYEPGFMEHRPNLKKWYLAVGARPSWKVATKDN